MKIVLAPSASTTCDARGGRAASGASLSAFRPRVENLRSLIPEEVVPALHPRLRPRNDPESKQGWVPLLLRGENQPNRNLSSFSAGFDHDLMVWDPVVSHEPQTNAFTLLAPAICQLIEPCWIDSKPRKTLFFQENLPLKEWNDDERCEYKPLCSLNNAPRVVCCLLRSSTKWLSSEIYALEVVSRVVEKLLDVSGPETDGRSVQQWMRLKPLGVQEVLIDVDSSEFLSVIHEREQTDRAGLDTENIFQSFGRGEAKAFDTESLAERFQVQLLVLREAHEEVLFSFLIFEKEVFVLYTRHRRLEMGISRGEEGRVLEGLVFNMKAGKYF